LHVERKIVAGLYNSIRENINVEDNPIIQAPENVLAFTCKYASWVNAYCMDQSDKKYKIPTTKEDLFTQMISP
jgi:hypothetical protein